MKILVTGATGLIGKQLTLKLAMEGHAVHALYRSFNKTENLNHPNIRFFKGDLLDYPSLERAAEDCQVIFHLASFAKQWSKNPETFYRINVKGTENLITAAKENHVTRLIITSTAGKFGPSNSEPVTENTRRTIPFFNEYEQTKDLAEKLALEAADDELEVVVVSPTRVYGPGELSESNGVTRLIKMYLEGKFRFIPGNGKSIGNYAFIDDVVAGHILALKHGKSGENYILGGENISFNEFFTTLARAANKSDTAIHLPQSLLYLVAGLFEVRTKLLGKAPLITRKWLKRYLYNWKVSSEKAIRELAYSITPFDIGLKKTLNWLEKSQ